MSQGRGKHTGKTNKMARYKAEGRREKNKLKKLKKILKKQPNNTQISNLIKKIG
jgi:hypothetical protein